MSAEDNVKKLLLIGDSDLLWMKKYIENVPLKCKELRIFLLSSKKVDDSDFYAKYGITVIAPRQSFVNLVPGVSRSYLCLMIRKTIRRYGYFDYVHLHYITREKITLIPYVKKHAGTICVTFWGSDLLRKEKKQLLWYKKYLCMVQFITVGTQNLLKRFREIYGKEFDNKIVFAKFGLDSLEHIKAARGNYEQLRVQYGISTKKKVITIGYNGNENQNHIKVLEEIRKCPQQVIDQLYLILPMTYGAKQDYIRDVEKELIEIGCQYKIFCNFMTGRETAEIRVITDVFIHAQPTDALSASVQEYLFASKLVINPKWINYYEFKELGVYYWEYEEFDELSKLVMDYFANTMNDCVRSHLDNNQILIGGYSSWELLRSEWEKLYR